MSFKVRVIVPEDIDFSTEVALKAFAKSKGFKL